MSGTIESRLDNVASGGGGGSGTVTSVGLKTDSTSSSIFANSGNNIPASPVTTSGNFTLTFSDQSANTVFAGPTSGGAAAPAFRALVAADIPNLPASIITSGALAIARGGTGQATATLAFNALSPMTTLGDVIYGAASGVGTRLAGNTTATKNFLTQTGTGAVSAAPAWGTIAVADVPNLPSSIITSGVFAVARGGTNHSTLVNAIGNSGSTQTIDWTNGLYQTITMTADCTVTWAGAVTGETLTIEAVQNSTGSFQLILPTTDYEDDVGFIPDPANRKSLVRISYNGTRYTAKQFRSVDPSGKNAYRVYRSPGASHYFDGGTSVLAGNTGAFTVGCWFKTPSGIPSGAPSYTMVSKDDRTSGSTKRMFQMQIAGNATTQLFDLSYYVWDNTAGAFLGKTQINMLPGVWYWCVGVYDGGTNVNTSVLMYANAYSIGTNLNNGSFTAITSTNGNFLVGAEIPSGGGHDRYYIGDLGPVSVWSTALSAAAIKELYQTRRPIDYSLGGTSYTSSANLLNYYLMGGPLDSSSTIHDYGSAALDLTGSGTSSSSFTFMTPQGN